jgi:hypothetical protein
MDQPRLVYEAEELLQSHVFASPQIEAGRLLHGGFDAEGTYLPPRLLHRGPALDAWEQALRGHGGALLAADASLLAGIRYPSEAQSSFLIREGLGQTFWNTLTITGKIEARGRILADMSFPELQDAVWEDVSGMAVGHLNKGLLRAHGLDEGGEPDAGIGGHDAMWFALRDLAFGETDFPDPLVPENIGRPESALQIDAELAEPIARMVYFLLNLLMIEFRAERGFSFTERVLRDPSLFVDRRAEAEHAAEIVGRIRIDEDVHVRSLRLYLGELRSLHFRSRDGGRRPGDRVVDPMWRQIVHWATVEQPPQAAEQQREILHQRISRHPEAERVLKEFDALEARA